MLHAIRRSRVVTWVLGSTTGEDAAIDESTPLVAAAERVSPTPLPKRQLFILCLMRFGEPIAFTVIFPFINQMIEDLHVTDDPKKVGYYAGIIESLFAFTTFATILGWGRLSDRIGRKPVMIFGLLGVSLSIICFGLSKTFIGLIVTRCLGGGLNGNVAVIKSMLGEITDESNQGRAFSFLPLAWSIGSVIGPLLGGSLSNPAINYPEVFGGVPFWETYPYALPCIIGGVVPAIAAVLGFLFLDETLPSRKPLLQKDPSTVITQSARHKSFVTRVSTTIPAGESANTTPGSHTPQREEGDDGLASGTVIGSIRGGGELEQQELEQETPPFSALMTKTVLSVLVTYAVLALQTISMDSIFVLFAYTRVSIGGLGFRERDIGRALSFAGVCTVLFQVGAFPPLQKRLGTVKLYRCGMALYPFIFSLFPIMQVVAKIDDDNGRGKKRVWILMIIFIVLKSAANMVYGANMLMVTNAAPSRRLLGTLNGVAQMTSSLMRSIGPFAASSLFAFSLEHHDQDHWFLGQLAFYVLIFLSLVGFASTRLLQEKVVGWREVSPKAENLAVDEEPDLVDRRAV